MFTSQQHWGPEQREKCLFGFVASGGNWSDFQRWLQGRMPADNKMGMAHQEAMSPDGGLGMSGTPMDQRPMAHTTAGR